MIATPILFSAHAKLNAENEQRQYQQTVYREHECNTTASGIEGPYVGKKGGGCGHLHAKGYTLTDLSVGSYI
jgi:hypothetical protein